MVRILYILRSLNKTKYGYIDLKDIALYLNRPFKWAPWRLADLQGAHLNGRGESPPNVNGSLKNKHITQF